MTPERFVQIDKLLEAALDLATDERGAFLARECAEDQELLEQVQALLAQASQISSFLESPATLGETAPTAQISGSEPIDGAEAFLPERLGAYRIIGLLGRGGMGSVYRAERVDGSFQGQVAIKFLRPGFEATNLQSRFQAERQILSEVRHENIARLLDGGKTADGRPFFVLELVEGLPIDRYCEEHRLGISERLQLFDEVCAGVEHAHRHLVVHRDIKPGNILVTAEGRPVLLDFGIAKVLDVAAFPYPVEATASHMRPMTPSYASPEQHFGEAISTASDIYSLGVLLYLLLCGQLPRDLRGKSPLEVEKILREGAVEKASEVAARQRFPPKAPQARAVAPELDSIASMALRLEPERRYGSVQQLRDELDRFRTGRPVLAQGDSMAYRTRKFLRRHWLPSAFAATLLIFILVFAGSMAASASRLAREREAVKLERDRAREVSHMMVEMLISSDKRSALHKKANLTVADTLDYGLELARKRLADQPEIRASLSQAIGEIYHGLGEHQKAQEVLEETLEIRQEVLGEEHVDLALTLHNLAFVLEDRGDPKAALPFLLEAIRQRKKLIGPTCPELAISFQNLCSVYTNLGRLEEAAAAAERALEIREIHFGPDDPWIGQSMQNLGNLYAARSQFDRAEEVLQRSLEIAEKNYGPVHHSVSYSAHALATAKLVQHEFSEAETWLTRVIDIREELYSPTHPELLLPRMNVGLLETHRGQFDPAIEALDRAWEILEKSGGTGGIMASGIRSRRAWLLQRFGELEQARGDLDAALEVFDRTMGRTHRPMETVLALAENLLLDNQIQEALETLDELQSHLEARNLKGTLEEAWAWRLRGSAHRTAGDLALASEAHEQSLDVFGHLRLLEMIPALEAQIGAAYLELDAARLPEAEERFRTALERAKARLAHNDDPSSRRLMAAALLGLGQALDQEGLDEEAKNSRRRAVQVLGQHVAAESDVFYLHTRVQALRATEAGSEATPWFEEYERRGGPGALAFGPRQP